MAVLRSRVVTPKPKQQQNIQNNNRLKIDPPVTPSQTREPSTTEQSPTPDAKPPDQISAGSGSFGLVRRRSLRLAAKSDPGQMPTETQIPNKSRKRKSTSTASADLVVVESKDKEKINGVVMDEEGVQKGLGLGSGAKFKAVLDIDLNSASEENCGDDVKEGVENSVKRSRRFSREEKGKGKAVINLNLDLNAIHIDDDDEEEAEDDVELVKVQQRKPYARRNGIVIDELRMERSDCDSEEVGAMFRGRISPEERAKGGTVERDLLLSLDEGIGDRVRKRYSVEEKGKGVLVERDLLSSLEGKVDMDVDETVETEAEEVRAPEVDPGEEYETAISRIREARRPRRMQRFHEIARANASRFAHFAPEEEEEEEDDDSAPGKAEPEVEDWPGPFSTAMKIIRDREKKMNLHPAPSVVAKEKPNPVTWVPRGQGQQCSKKVAPSLKELCIKILAKNADDIESLEHVPDALRHTLSQKLCDSRKMNNHAFDLLVSGCPTEVRLRDCSWLTEEQFTESFQKCDTSNLTVLQLDLCGRCTPDYVVQTTLAKTPNSLSALTTLSLIGACRLSDVGLKALVTSAPRLRSINLSMCSLLTSSSISVLADSLGSVLRELYIDDCQSIDAMCILPALKKLEQLEVLSLKDVSNVCDKFLREFITAHGYNMKELGLADCSRVTDSSIKVISENCSALCALDLSNLTKLTDSALGHLANGCQAIQTLRLCRNSFSDEAIAAFLETCGQSLRDLSLNNCKKVGHNTALSIAKQSRNLIMLDLSWCRNLSNEAVGLIIDSCLSLKVLKLFGCTQITNKVLDGYSNPEVRVIGPKMSPIMEPLIVPDAEECALQYSSVSLV